MKLNTGAATLIKKTSLIFTAFVLAVSTLTAAVPFVLAKDASAASYGSVIVRSGATQGWASTDTTSGGAQAFIVDSGAPYGYGALQMTTTANPAAKSRYSLATGSYFSPVNLSSVKSGLAYSTKQNSASFSAGLPAFQLTTYLGGGLSGFTTLTYEPYVSQGNGAVQNGAWQTWDVSAGKFYSSRAVGTLQASQGTYTYTLDEILGQFPSARVGAVGVNVGSNNLNYDVQVDGIKFNGQVYDFEPAAPPVTPTNLRFNSDKACGYATNVNSITPTWNAVSGAVSYNYKATLPGGAVFGPTNVGNVTSISGSFGAQGTSTFSVQAVAANGLTSDWATPCAASYDITVPTGIDDLAGIIHGTVTVTQHIDDNIAPKSGKLRIWKLTSTGAQDNSKFFSIGDLSVNGSGNVVYTLDTIANLFGEGKYVAKFTATDTAGNATISSQKNFTVDNTAPTFTVKPESIGSGGLFEKVSYKLYDANQVDKVVVNGVSKDLTNSTYSDLNSLKPGAFGAVEGVNTIVLYDVAGNTATLTVILDTLAPEAPTTLGWTTDSGDVLASGASTHEYGGVATWNASASSDVHHYIYKYWNSIEGNQYKEGSAYTTTTGSLSSAGVFNQGEGTHYFAIAAVDNLGHTSAFSAPFEITYNTEVDASIDAITTGATPTVSGTAWWVADNEDYANQPLTLIVNGTSYNTTTDVNGDWSVNTTEVLPNAKYTARVQQNTTTIVEREFTVAVVQAPTTPGGGTDNAPQPVNTGEPLVEEGGDELPSANGNPATGFAAILGNGTTGNAADNTGTPEVEGTSTEEQLAAAANNTDGNAFGLAWYWWLLIIAGGATGIWWLIAALRGRSAE